MTTKLISVVRTGAPCNVFDLVLDKGIDFETGQARQVSETTAQALLSDPAGGPAQPQPTRRGDRWQVNRFLDGTRERSSLSSQPSAPRPRRPAPRPSRQ